MTPVDPERRERLAHAWRTCRDELVTYVTRLVVRADVAEEIVQEAAVRLLETPGVPEGSAATRAWLFRVASNLGIDHLRRHSTWRETVLLDARERAQVDGAFIAESQLMRGSPETKAIAREHLAVCLSCTLRNLKPEESAALLLKEVHDFTTDELAEMLGASFGQAKNWVQSARLRLTARYGETCALVTQKGVCYQCVELDQFFTANRGDPLAGSDQSLDARLAILRDLRATPLGPWHRRLMRLVDELLDEA
jgi:RNA polymerase sigma-70 factor (ECF subfamily)